eukprot:scaffold92507_cov60-Phaeocystis_antarctica.AAC.2
MEHWSHRVSARRARRDGRHRHGLAVGGALADVDAHPPVALQRPAADAQGLRLSDEGLSDDDSVSQHGDRPPDSGTIVTVMGHDAAAAEGKLERRVASQIFRHDRERRRVGQ